MQPFSISDRASSKQKALAPAPQIRTRLSARFSFLPRILKTLKGKAKKPLIMPYTLPIGRAFTVCENGGYRIKRTPTMSRELIIYCDESDISGKHFSNFYGGALVESVHQSEVIERLEGRKAELNLGAEVKWQKISEAYAGKYVAFAEEIFALMREGKLKLRVMFTQNYFAAAGLDRARREEAFFMLYYQFVKHAFGLRYAGIEGQDTGLRVHFDKLPDTREKCSAFKGFVLGLNKNIHFNQARILLREDQIAEVDSKHHVIMQSLDVVLGAMQFRLNDKHKEKPEGQRHRGKRTRAKEGVYKEIYGLIRGIYPGYQFNIGISTGTDGDPAAKWHDPYRHWLFLPRELEIKREYAKRQRPAAAT